MSGAKEHPDDAAHFFQALASALPRTAKLLVVGPAHAKLDFLRYLHAHDAELEKRVAGIETVDHPTDRQLVAYAKQYFHVPPPPGAEPHAAREHALK